MKTTHQFLIILAALPFTSQSQTINLTDTSEKDHYLMVTVSANYYGFNIVAGTSIISIIRPGNDVHETINPKKNEDFRVRVVKELNTLASEGWKIVSSHQSVIEGYDESNRTRVETVYILTKPAP